ncbi:serine/threonine-protein kinase ATG1a-like protein isoform X2 [Cinnamomum micranthum f. kanehirae]|uniref:Serine/threonine-protein kinase ATG1a-like protein isoform X2 n=1 Tax=Cinnamomum micranthum f. kanehirae TaxID=337451 RepID=A0A443PAD4_9MAGN|nr:serine/threonine-protein kinase ATG1a-like protein isoform X2 [Cinnamomum micranthum f. kanehirae]
MEFGENRCTLVGDYILGPKIGSGSFSVVWLARHRCLGDEVAVKEIEKKNLSNNKAKESLFKEISTLSPIRHPNIIRLYEAIETAEKIFLVLEYCVGGDLAAYIQRFGRVSEDVARHFMRQLASGLQVLRENNLIHRDLKPQNLLLSSKDETPVLKIGDFGFARYLKPQGLADTVCGSPLYMAPEIILGKKYDAKADLWSVGAILFQLITGKPPFGGNNEYQLYQNILKSNELQFPQNVVDELHADCIDLCKSLLRRNPDERLTFEEFFNHKFMAEPRPAIGVGYSSLLLDNRTPADPGDRFIDDKSPFTSYKGPQLHSDLFSYSARNCPELISRTPSHDESVSTEKKDLFRNDHDRKESTFGAAESVHGSMLNATDGNVRKSVDCNPSSSSDQENRKIGSINQGLLGMNTSKVADSMELIERDYVLVNSHCASTDSVSLEASVQDISESRHSLHPLKTTGKCIAVQKQAEELSSSSVCDVDSFGSHGPVPLEASQALVDSADVRSLHPSMKLRSLHQYVHALSELAQEKFNAQLPLESFSVQLVVLAVWREALRVYKSLVAINVEGETIGSSSANECPPDQDNTYLSLSFAEGVDFNSPASVCSWAEGFIVAYDRTEKISNYLPCMNVGAEMPDAMEIIFQAALAAGKNGAVDELMGNRSSAAAAYSRATILLSFILQEAPSLPLNPPFSLIVSDQQRIHRYISCLKTRQSHLEMHARPIS